MKQLIAKASRTFLIIMLIWSCFGIGFFFSFKKGLLFGAFVSFVFTTLYMIFGSMRYLDNRNAKQQTVRTKLCGSCSSECLSLYAFKTDKDSLAQCVESLNKNDERKE